MGRKEREREAIIHFQRGAYKNTHSHTHIVNTFVNETTNYSKVCVCVCWCIFA